ncbi:retroviral-like aspartic protease family protein [Bacteroidia bacterium]|nr:retroviral-like aspartic protease family protein [Bacteroidia bacterium]
MKKKGGVYTIPCEVNGLRLRFIFDTGASDVSISSTEALFMLKNGYLDANDLLGSTEYQIANGENIEGKKINLKRLRIGGKTLYNVKASIIYSSNAPLLLGQSAMNRFEEITLDYKTNTVYLGEHPKLKLLSRNFDSLETEYRLLDYSTKKKTNSYSETLKLNKYLGEKITSLQAQNKSLRRSIIKSKIELENIRKELRKANELLDVKTD